MLSPANVHYLPHMSMDVVLLKNAKLFFLSMSVHLRRNQAKGGERAWSSRTSCMEGEMLVVIRFKSPNDAVCIIMTLFKQ